MKLLKLSFLFSFQFFYQVTDSQTLNISVKANLPSILTQSSGIVVTDRNSIWSHNDSSGNPELYNFDSTGTLLRTLKILNAGNIDWEDLATDTSGNFYIGDFGNNNNIRQDLKIYIIPDPSTLMMDSVIPQVISYTYPDQYAFPPADSLKNFDAEAMVTFHDSLYIFSKNWSSPYNGYTKLYRMPTIPGTYVAELVDSFYTGSGPPLLCSITSADISPDKSKLMLLGYNKCWLFSDFAGADFFSGSSQLFNLPLSQKEAIGFITNDEFYATDELVSGTGQKLFYLQIQPVEAGINEQKTEELKITVSPNPFSEESTISVITKVACNYALVLYNELGQLIFEKSVSSVPEIPLNFSLDESVFKNNSGIFTIEISMESGVFLRKKIVRIQ